MASDKKKYLLKRIKAIGLLFMFAVVLVFVLKNAFLYTDTIAKVISVKNIFSHEEGGPNGETEQYYDQEIKARILNGSQKGKEIELSNTYSSSGVNDERYRKGNQIFVSVDKEGKSGIIEGRKRDIYIAFLIGIFLFLILFMNEWQGGIIAVSLVINMSVFLVALWKYGQGENLITLAYILMLVFSVITLLFASGFHKKTLVAIVATLLTTLLCYGIYQIVLVNSTRLPYEMMDYVVSPDDLSDLFLTGILMGSLGAVMDVSISIAAGVSEIVKQTPDIRLNALVKSVREMGYDIMGTMINVLFFTYISGAIPMMVIKIRNGYTLYHMIHFQLVFEIVRFLMGAIGIVLSIPVAGVCAIFFLHKGAFLEWRRKK